ncbi:glutathione S-transferase N-terminal domain-containing protein [Pseudomonas sp. P154a]|uniref:glutathione S-transferase N-terminal domain-containing protein n=1 Tax=Pseudomonas TaxID=286 RepID=UPI00072111D6|nr:MULTISPECIES: glutathione S-transferase N-terminal domain-containing protein [Pseudomonas]MBF6043166.1 glutathione S-transferase N-terminal domain-containing protein [Pseudomonas mucoides]CRL51532.1 glutathionine S-transferase [Pseudomonas sp. URMO17WK12:I11]
MYQLYGHQNSGAAAIEAALELCEIPYRFIDVELSSEAAQALEKLNRLKQIPTLQLPDGSILTESAAILIHLGLTFPKSNLLPTLPADRDQAIRGLTYIVSNCYAAIGIIDYPERWLAETDEASRQNLTAGARARLHWSWEVFADQFSGELYLGDETPGALDVLAAVVSRWAGSREHLRNTRPGFFAWLERIDRHPTLAPVFARHWPV